MIKNRNTPEHDDKQVKTPLAFVNVCDLINKHSDYRGTVVEGLLRMGETLNLISAPKVGKSWLALLLAFCVATGLDWLGFRCKRGRVLIVDNELHPETLSARMKAIAESIAVNSSELNEMLDVLTIRGQNVTIDDLPRLLAFAKAHEYSLIVLDAFYRILPDGSSENDNAAMTRVYNELDYIAATTGAAIAIVHHSSKGDQSQKAQTDVGSGAGSIARCADTHLTIRPHESDGLFVLEAVTRSFRTPEPISLCFNWPLWAVDDTLPMLRTPKSRGDVKQAKNDQVTKDKLLEALKGGKRLSVRQLRTKTGFGQGRIERGLTLIPNVKTRRVKRKATGKASEVFWIEESIDAPNDAPNDDTNF